MPRKPKAIVFDSWAVIAYLEDEPAAERLADHIADAHDDGIPLFMCVVNAGEVWSIIAREASVNDADRSIHQLRQLGIEFVDANWHSHTRQVASSRNTRCPLPTALRPPWQSKRKLCY
jgi:uncharacterized protein with PIN domain